MRGSETLVLPRDTLPNLHRGDYEQVLATTYATVLKVQADPGRATDEDWQVVALHAIATAYTGDPARAVEVAMGAYRHLLESQGPHGETTIAAQRALAVAQLAAYDVHAALGNAESAHALYVNTYGEDAAVTLDAAADLATCLHRSARCGDGLRLMQSTVDAYLDGHGQDPTSIGMLARLGAMLRDCGQFDRAHQLLGQARQLARTLLPPGDGLITAITGLSRAGADASHACTAEPSSTGSLAPDEWLAAMREPEPTFDPPVTRAEKRSEDEPDDHTIAMPAEFLADPFPSTPAPSTAAMPLAPPQERVPHMPTPAATAPPVLAAPVPPSSADTQAIAPQAPTPSRPAPPPAIPAQRALSIPTSVFATPVPPTSVPLLPAPPAPTPSRQAPATAPGHGPQPKRPEVPAKVDRQGTMTTLSLLSRPPHGERELRDWLRRSLGGPRQITVVNPKGGAGKTVATLMLGLTFGQARGGYVLAWDNNETQGTLGMRAQFGHHQRTVRDLLPRLHHFASGRGGIAELASYLREQEAAGFDVLASDEATTVGGMLTARAFRDLRDVITRFYKLVVVDTGNNVRAENWRAAVDATDQLVVTVPSRSDAAETAARTLDHLDLTDRRELVRRAIVVVTETPQRIGASRAGADLRLIETHFQARCRAVLRVPYDRHLDSGSPITYRSVAAGTRRSWLRVAAAVMTGL